MYTNVCMSPLLSDWLFLCYRRYLKFVYTKLTSQVLKLSGVKMGHIQLHVDVGLET